MNLNQIGTLSVKVTMDDSELRAGVSNVPKAAKKAGDDAGNAFADAAGKGGKKAADEIDDGLKKGLPDTAETAGAAGKKAGTKFSQGLSSARSGVDKALLPAVGVLGGLAAGAWEVTQSASSVAEAQSKVGQVFGDTSAEVIEWSKRQDDALSQKQALDAAANLAVMGSAAGLSGQDLNKFSIDLVNLSSDISSFYDASSDEALNALSAGLRGEAEPLRKYGVMLNSASLQAKALEMGLVSANVSEAKVADQRNKSQKATQDYAAAVKQYGEDSQQAADALIKSQLAEEALAKTLEGKVAPLEDSQKALAAQAIIMESTTVLQGDFARTSDGLANSQRTLSSNFEDTKAALGEGLLPIMTQGVQLLTTFNTWAQNNIGTVKLLAGAVGALAASVVVAKVGFVLYDTAIRAYAIAQKIATAAQWLWNAALAANPLGLIIIAIAALVAGLIWAYSNVEWFRDMVDAALAWVVGAFGWLVDGAKAVWNWISENWPLLLAILTGPFGLAVKFIIDNWESITTFFSELPGMLADIGITLVNAITWPWRTAVNFIIGLLNTIVDFWNGLEFTFPQIDTPWGATIGGWTVGTPDIGRIPDIPALAKGGVVQARRGGTLALLGEAGQDEAVVPLDRAGGFGNTINVTVNVQPGGVGDPRTIKEAAHRAMNETLRNGALQLVAAGR